MGKIAELGKKASTEDQFDLLDYLSNLAPIQYLGNKIDDAAKYLGLEHGLSGTIAKYLGDITELNDPNSIGNPQYTGYRSDDSYQSNMSFYKLRDNLVDKYKLSKAEAAKYAEDLMNNKQSATSEMMPRVDFMENPDEQLNNPEMDDINVQYKKLIQELMSNGMSFDEADKLAIKIIFGNGRIAV